MDSRTFAIASGSKSARMTPCEGLAFLTSAISRIGPGAASAAKKFARWQHVRDPPLQFRGRAGRLGRGNFLPLVGDNLVKNRGHEITNAIREGQITQALGAACGHASPAYHYSASKMPQCQCMRGQCLKCRRPVSSIAMPCRLQAAVTSSSLREPPGWTTAFTPAAAARSIESANGKNASEPMTRSGGPICPPSRSRSARCRPGSFGRRRCRATSDPWPARWRCSSHAARSPRRIPGRPERRRWAPWSWPRSSFRSVGQHVGLLPQQATVDLAMFPARLRRPPLADGQQTHIRFPFGTGREGRQVPRAKNRGPRWPRRITPARTKLRPWPDRPDD